MGRRIGIIIAVIVGILLLAGLLYLGYRFFTRGSGTITVWTLPGNEEAVKSVATIFQRSHRGYRVNIVPTAESEYEMKALFSLAAQKEVNNVVPPDIWIVPNEWMPLHRNKLVAAPDGAVTGAIESYKRRRPKGEATPQFPAGGRSNVQVVEQDYAPIVKSDVVAENKVWGIPLHMDTLALFYDRSKVSSPPTTWQSVADVTKQTTQRNGDTISRSAIALGDNESVTHAFDILSVLMLQSGTSMVDETSKTAEFNIAKTGSVAPGPIALDYYTSFARSNKETYTWNKTLGQSLDAFKGGRTAMVLGYLNDAAKMGITNEQRRAGIAPLPQSNPNNPQTYGRYLVATVTKQAAANNNQAKARAAWDLAALFANPDIAEQYATDLRVAPARKDVAKRMKLADIYKPFLDQVPTAVNWSKREVAVANGALNEALELVLKRGESSQIALDVASKTYTAFLRAETGIETDSKTLSLWQSTEDSIDYTDLASEFSTDEITRIKVSKHTPERYEWETLNAMAARLGPDILLLPNDRLPRFVSTLNRLPRGVISNIEEGESEIEALRRIYVPAVVSDNFIDGKMYGLPIHLETLMIAYNADLMRQIIKEHDKAIPENLSETKRNEQRINESPYLWDDIKKLATQIVRRSGASLSRPFIAVGTGSNVAHSEDIYAAAVKQFGGDMTDPDHNVTGIHLPISSQNSVIPGKQAEELLKGFSDPANNFFTWDKAQPNSLEALADGKVVAAFIYPRDIKKITDRNPLINLKFLPLPQRNITDDAVDMASYYSLTVPVSSKNPSQALQFIANLTIDTESGTFENVVPPTKRSEDVPIQERASTGNSQRVQRNSAQSYYKGQFPGEFNQSLIDLMDGRVSLDQAASRINQALKKKVL